MSIFGGPKVVTDNLILCLDAGNKKSYPGSGTVWYDLTPNNNNFNIIATAYNAAGYMDFNGAYGCAKNSTDISLSDATGVTYHIVTRVKNSTAEWRTLTRSYDADHQVIIESGGWNIGMYDNNGAGFLGTGFSQQNLPGNGTTTWIQIYWRWQSSSPYYQFSYNDSPTVTRGTIADANSRYNRGFGSLGAYHNGSTDPANSSQYWGDIAYFAAYNRFLNNSELLQNYNALKGRFKL